jgi:hypothetical protein
LHATHDRRNRIHEARLRTEMANIQRLLDAYAVFRSQIGNVAAAPGPPATLPITAEATASPSPPPPPPAYVPPPRYIHPELKTMSGSYNSKGAYVEWAIRRMTDNFCLRDIQALLEREGIDLSSPDISCVLTRMKTRGQITEIKPGAGRTPAIFRGPENAANPRPNQTDPTGSTETPPGSGATVL